MITKEALFNLIASGLRADKEQFRHIAIKLAKSLKDESPELSEKIFESISRLDIGQDPFRSIGFETVPIDKESSLQLLQQVMNPSDEKPILGEKEEALVKDFIFQHKSHSLLIKNGYFPPTSLLLTGEPGVGKTMLAEYIASQMGRPLLTLDLAATISSFLGKTGQNLKSVLSYARSISCVLFLDEFDAVAKKRDDASDLGELKRIVNVLLKELENWPYNSLVIAATNHPQLLDKAIWRRFDVVVNVPLPKDSERLKIFSKYFPEMSKSSESFKKLIMNLSKNLSASDITETCLKCKRKFLLYGSVEDWKNQLICELIPRGGDISNKEKSEIIKQIKHFVPNLTLEEVGGFFDLSASGVHYHLKEKQNG